MKGFMEIFMIIGGVMAFLGALSMIVLFLGIIIHGFDPDIMKAFTRAFGALSFGLLICLISTL